MDPEKLDLVEIARREIEYYIHEKQFDKARRWAQSAQQEAAEVGEALLASVEIAETVHNARQADLKAMLPNFKKGDRVKVIKPFEETRTPCPRIGTPGKVVEIGEEYIKVKFRSGFTCASDRAQWHRDGGFIFKFLPDEVEVSPL